MKVKKLSALILSLLVVMMIAAIGTSSVSAATSSSTTVTVGVETDHTPLAYGEYYHYSSLSKAQKTTYDVIYNAIIKIEAKIDLSSCKISMDNVYDIYSKVLADHPEIFYVTTGISISGGQEYATSLTVQYKDGKGGTYNYDKAAITEQIKKFNNKTKEILSQVPVNATQLVKEKAIHDILSDRVSYDHDVLGLEHEEMVNYFDWCSYGAIVEGSAVCEGYAEAFAYLCHCVGINATTITGHAGGGHMWNAVEIEDEWYLVDVTWDDTDDESLGTIYNYFNVTSAQMGKDHTPNQDHLPYPICTATKNSYKAFTIDFQNEQLPSNYKSVIDMILELKDSKLPIYVGKNVEFDFDIKNKYFTGKNSPIMQYIKSKGYVVVFKDSYLSQGEYVWLSILNISEACKHSWKSATCLAPKTCKTCKATTGKALGHKYDSGKVTTKATCTKNGVKTYTCSTCKATKTETITKLGHKYSNACDKTCNTCGAKRTIKHTYKLTTTKKATLTANGKQEYKCTCCGYVTSSNAKTVYKVTSFKLSATSYTYNGKVQTPSVVVKNANGTTLKKGTDYDVTYASGRKNVGTYKVTIKMKGKYTGTKTLTFKINPIKSTTCSFKLSATSYTYNGKVKTPSVVVKNANGTTLKKGTDYDVTYASGRKNVGTYKVTIKMKGKYTGTKTLTFKINPTKTTLSKVTPATKKLTVSITKKTAQVTGYEIQYSTSSKFTTKTTKTKVITKNTTTKTTITKLAAKKTYYVRVRTYKTVSGKKYYSGWSTVKSAKTK